MPDSVIHKKNRISSYICIGMK